MCSHKDRWLTEVRVKSLELFLAWEKITDGRPCVASVLVNITFSPRCPRRYWWDIWRMHPWPIWVLITRPSGLRSLHRELKSKPCVNVHCTLTLPWSRSAGFCKINHLKLVRLVSSMQISLPILNYLLVIRHSWAKGGDLDVEAWGRATVMCGRVSTCHPPLLFLFSNSSPCCWI